MGQFASKAFDGDPYIDIMRALPERELVWWVQKVIWVAEGYTFFEHFKRTYPATLLHKCQHCNGAGTVTCPECHGYKQRRVLSPVFKLSERTASGRLADSHMDECKSCGSYCPWDAEEAWHAKWGAWESKLSYYDRTYGPLFDEWYDDVLNEGNLELDSPEPEDPIPGPQRAPGPDWDVVRDIAKSSRRMEALMRRFGGHPYENEDMIPYEAVDPTLSIGENVYALMENYNYLPLELNPEARPDLLLEPNGPFARFHEEIDMEFSIMSNLDAAIKDTMKPYNFGPSAGTVPCPVCHNEPYFWSLTPNGDKILDLEEPFWVRTLRLMGANHWLMQPGGTPPPPFLDDRRQAQATLRPAQRRHGEYPSVTAEEVEAAAVPSTLELVTGRAVTQTQRYRPYLEKLVFGKPSGREPVYMYDFGINVVEEPSEWVEEPGLHTRLEGLKERAAAGKIPAGEAVRQATREVAGQAQRELNSHPIYGQRRKQSAKAGSTSWYREKHRHDNNTEESEELLRGG